MKPNGPGESGVVRASAVRAALPSVVNDGDPVFGIASHGPCDAGLESPRSHPGADSQQPMTRVSVDGYESGEASKNFHDGLPAALGVPAAVLTF
jgi:hypothetical protein